MTAITFLLTIPLMLALGYAAVSFILLCRDARQEEMDLRLARERAVRGDRG